MQISFATHQIHIVWCYALISAFRATCTIFFISVLLSWTYTIKGLSVYIFIFNITFPTFILWSVQAVHTPSLARIMCLPSSTCGYLIYTYVLPVALIIVSLMTGVHVHAWTVYHSCVCCAATSFECHVCF